MNNRHDVSADLRYFYTKLSVRNHNKNSLNAQVNKYAVLGENQHRFCRENIHLKCLLHFFVGASNHTNYTITTEYLEFKKTFDEVPY